MGRPIFAQIDRIVSPDEDGGYFHQCAEPKRTAAVVAEHQEAGAIGPESGQSHAIHEGAHRVLANAEMKVAAGIAPAVFRGLELARTLEGQERLGGRPQIGRPAQ